MKRFRLRSALAAATSVVGAAVVWWIYSRPPSADAQTQCDNPWRKHVADAQTQCDNPWRKHVADAQTQCNNPWREHVEEIVAETKGDKVCYNVLYTAALYATNHENLTLDTWTKKSKNDKTTLGKWHSLKGRHSMMLRALEKLGAQKSAFELYKKHRAHVQERASN